MRKTFFIAAAFSILTSAQAQKETIEGNGNMITKEIAVSPFESLKASGVYELKLSQGATEAVKIEADENLQQYFDVRNKGRQLVIEMKNVKNKNWKGKSKMKVYVTFRSLKDLDLNTVGSVKGEAPLSFADLSIKNNSVGALDLNLSADHLTLKNNSVGNVRLAGKAQQANFINNGVGQLKAGDFVVQTVSIENEGVGSAEVNAAKGLKAKDTMLGRVSNKGAAPMKKNNRVEI